MNVEIEAASIDTRDAKRDEHLKSADFFDVEKFPTMTFTSTRVEPKGDDPVRRPDDPRRHPASRARRRVQWPGRQPVGPAGHLFSAQTKINRKDFGLNWNAALESGGMLVSDEVKISLELEANS